MTAAHEPPKGLDPDALADVRPGMVALEIPPGAEHLSLVRVVIAAAAEIEPDMDSTRIEDLRVAVSEATTNAMEAHELAAVAEPVRIRCELADGALIVVVADRGPGFDPATLSPMPDPDHPDRVLRERGLGVHLMRELADDLEISSGEAGTEVRLVFLAAKRRRKESDR